MAQSKETRRKLLFRALGGLITALTGVLLLLLPGDAFQDLSFDLVTRWKPNDGVTNAIIIYFNQSCLDVLLQSNGFLKPESFSPPLRTSMPPDRRIYVTLLDVLKKAGARLVFFDCNFHEPHPGEDKPFADAIRKNGAVMLGGIKARQDQQTGSDFGVEGYTLLPPNPTLKDAVKNWGILGLDPTPADGVARQLYTGDGQTNAAIFLAAQLDGFNEEATTERWINYYGPPNSIDHMLLPEALVAENASKFRGRAVFIGGNYEDLHPTPYSRFGFKQTLGAEILATSYVNLVRSKVRPDYLRRIPLSAQAIIVAVWGLFSVATFLVLRPRDALMLTPVLVAVGVAAGFYLQWEHHLWWAWAIPAFVQTPVAAGWAAIANRWFPWPASAFISYRRVEGEGGGYAQAVLRALEHRGFGAICDVQVKLTAKEFLPQLMELIDSMPDFILIMSKDSLDPGRINKEEDVLRAEIRQALKSGRNIITLMIDDYKMPAAEQLPPDIRQFCKHNAFVWRNEDPGSALEKVIANLHRPSLTQWLRPFKKTPCKFNPAKDID